jgi:hypothetical protein
MLYMKTRVTFRIADELADALRDLPNQTKFVEDALRDALGRACPVCEGSGRIPVRTLRVTNIRAAGIEELNRDQALELQRVFRLGRAVAATRIELKRRGPLVTFTMSRDRAELINGTLGDPSTN